MVPHERMKSSRDVVAPTFVDMQDSAYPLGIGVHGLVGENNKKKPLPLLYVSGKVANDRSPVHIDNPQGVVPGWYVIAEPGKQFEIYITVVNCKPLIEDTVSASLFVDGEDTNVRSAFSLTKGAGKQRCILGFLESQTVGNTGKTECVSRAFEFQKAWSKNSEESIQQSSSDLGTIRMECRFGTGRALSATPAQTTFNLHHVGAVTELESEKIGKSLTVKRDGKQVSKTLNLNFFSLQNERLDPNAEVKIYMRERRWMRTRRLIDDNGRPCTYSKYLELVRGDRERSNYQLTLLKSLGSAGLGADKNKPVFNGDAIEPIDVDKENGNESGSATGRHVLQDVIDLTTNSQEVRRQTKENVSGVQKKIAVDSLVVDLTNTGIKEVVDPQRKQIPSNEMLKSKDQSSPSKSSTKNDMDVGSNTRGERKALHEPNGFKSDQISATIEKVKIKKEQQHTRSNPDIVNAEIGVVDLTMDDVSGNVGINNPVLKCTRRAQGEKLILRMERSDQENQQGEKEVSIDPIIKTTQIEKRTNYKQRIVATPNVEPGANSQKGHLDVQNKINVANGPSGLGEQLTKVEPATIIIGKGVTVIVDLTGDDEDFQWPEKEEPLTVELNSEANIENGRTSSEDLGNQLVNNKFPKNGTARQTENRKTQKRDRAEGEIAPVTSSKRLKP